MIITKKIQTEIEEKISIKCDLCGAEYFYGKDWDDVEIEEFISVHTVGGYGSVFDDGENIDVDICQRCFKKNIMDKIKPPSKQNDDIPYQC